MSSIEELIKAVDSDKEAKLGTSVYKAAQANPEQSAKVYDLASKKGLPYDYVERHYDSVNRPNTEDLPKKVREFLSDRQKAAMAVDDVDNLSWWETAAQEGKSLASLIPSAGFSMTQGLYATGASVLNAAGSFSLWMDKKLGFVPEEAEGNFLMDGGQSLLDIAANQRQAADSFFPTESMLPDPVLGGVKSAFLNLPMIAASVFTRNPSLALSGMGTVTYGEAYQRGKDAGLSEADAIMLGVNSGIAEVVTEKIPLSKFIGDIGANAGFWRTVANQMAVEIPTEQLATVWQDAADWAALNPEKTLQEFIAERPEAAVDTLISTIVATGLQTSVISGIDRLANRQEQKAIEDIATKAQESKLNARSPDAFAQHVQEVAEEYGSVENIYLDATEARKLYQDLKQDAAFDIIREQIAEAEALGGDIVIPVGEFASKVATSENYNVLKGHFRITPESPKQSDLQTDQSQHILDLIKEANENLELKTRADQIFTDVSNQLIQTGRLTPEAAKYSASIIPAYVTSRAARSGLSVDEIYDMMGLKIIGPETDLATSQGVILDQMFPEENRVTSMSATMQERIKADNPSLAALDFAANPEITVYRATVGDSLRKDDFVAVERNIAEQHLENLRDRGEEGKIIEQQVRVGDLLMANDATEFVYWPEKLFNQSYTPEDLDFFKSQGLLTEEEAANLSAYGNQTEPQSRSARTVSGAAPREQWAEATAIKADGSPANVWRGAASPLSADDFGNIGRATGHPSAQLGVWFTSDQADAATYGTPSQYQLDIRSPRVFTLADDIPVLDSPEGYAQLREQLESEGFDGIVLDYSEVGGPQHIVVFAPEQVIEAGRDLFQSDNIPGMADNERGDRSSTTPRPQERSAEFQEWFRGSKVVDESGEPLVVYHGTRSDFDSFDASLVGQNTPRVRDDLPGGAVYFHSQREEAEFYAESEDNDGNVRQGDSPRVVEAYLSFKNPLVVDTNDNETNFFDQNARSLYADATDGEHDGVIVNGSDGTLYVAFDSDTIRSASPNQSPRSQGAGRQLEQSVFHGTPHTFDKFSLEAIGTGEGAQAYGWGLYFAGKKEAAEYYRDTLSGLSRDQISKGLGGDLATLIGDKGGVDQARTWIDEQLKRSERFKDASEKQEERYQYFLDLREAIDSVGSKPGSLYQVDIPDDSELLDWDKPISEQPETIREALLKWRKDNGDSFSDGEGAYRAIEAHYARQGSESPDRDAAAALNEMGIPGLRYLDNISRDGSGDSHNYVIWDESRVTVEAVSDELRQARDLLQGEKAGPRGVISLLPKESIIQLTKASDLTTFLHESAHLFLEMEGRLFNHPNATDGIKRDGQIILDYLGAESFESITTDQHETFARSFEQYLGEGKAPSVELQSVFRRFAAWIKQVYRSLSRLNVNLTDDMRQVFDRLLATDDQIDRMRGRFRPLFASAEEAGVTEREYQAYRNQSTPEVAKEKLRAKLLKQFERQHKQWWRDESAAIAKGIREDLLQDPTYQVVDTIRGGEFKLNRDEVKEILGVSKLPSKFNGLTSNEGRSPEEISVLYGISSHDLVANINDRPTLKQAVDEKTHEEMVRRHGDALTDGTLEAMAEQAAHDTEYGKKLATELAYLARKTKQPAIDRQAVKEYAKEKIASLPYSKIYPNRYRANEVRAARAAGEAKGRGDFALAQKHKQQELINFYLAKEAQLAKDKTQKIRSSLKAIQTRTYDSKKIDTEMVNQAKVLIAAYDFRKNNRESVELAKARIASVKNWIVSQQQNPDNVTTFVEAEILGKLIPYNEMSYSDLRGLDDVVKSIMFAAKRAMEADSEAYKREMAEGAEYLSKNRIETYETEIDSDTPWVRAKSTIQELFASLRKMESLVRQADGMNEQGWLWKRTIKPLLDASNNALAMRTEAHAKLNEIFRGFESAFNGLKDRRTFTLDSGRKITMSYGARISLALNMGNDSNMEALLTQGMTTKDAQPLLTENDINRIVATLSERDWDMVQNVWDYIDTFWPQISDLEIKRSGVAPQKVPAREFTTPSGKVMKGGYYPLVGDPIEDSKQLDQDISAQAQQMMQGGAAKKSTKHGSTIERVGFGGKKVDLSINVLFNHIDGVIHDITHWEAVRDADRVLRHPKIQSELNTSLGKPGARAIKDRLTEVAAGPQRINGMRGWNRVLRHARLAQTYSALGYSVRTSITNMIGITSAAMEMDARTVASGAAEYYSNIRSSNEFILSKSKYMRDRGEVLNRDIAYIRNNLKGDTRWNKIKDNAFWMMTQTDKAITRPIWLAAYRQGETMFDTEQEAIDHADRMVARTQGSGLDMDLSNVETRNELMKAMTVMFSAMNAIYNIVTEQVKRRKAGKINTRQLAMKLTWGIVVAGIAEELIRGTFMDDDDEGFVEASGWAAANMAVSLIPVGRDIASYAQYGSSFPTPIVQLGMAPVDVSRQAAQGEVDKAFIRSLSGLSAWALVPGGAQFNRTAGYLIDLNEGEVEEFSPWGLIVTGKE